MAYSIYNFNDFDNDPISWKLALNYCFVCVFQCRKGFYSWQTRTPFHTFLWDRVTPPPHSIFAGMIWMLGGYCIGFKQEIRGFFIFFYFLSFTFERGWGCPQGYPIFRISVPPKCKPMAPLALASLVCTEVTRPKDLIVSKNFQGSELKQQYWSFWPFLPLSTLWCCPRVHLMVPLPPTNPTPCLLLRHPILFR